MKKVVILLVTAICLVGCGQESPKSETFAHSYTENILVENIEVETIEVRSIEVKPIEITFDNSPNITRWD